MARPKAYPVKKVIGLDAEMAERIRNFRFDHRINTENEAIRRLLEAGLKAGERIPIRGAKPGGGPDQDAERGALKPGAKKPAAPTRKAEPATPLSKEAQIRALREQGAR